MLDYIRKRNKDIVALMLVVYIMLLVKAYLANGLLDTGEIQIIVNDIVDQLLHISETLNEDEFVNVEQIQDIVEKTLMSFEKFDIAKSYIVYRQERTKQRAQEQLQEEQKMHGQKFLVTKYDGSVQTFSVDKIKKLYEKIA
jgi:ribonucleoside-diphosphate reductase alpha chain